MGEPAHVADAVRQGGADAVAMADILHYRRATIEDIRAAAVAAGIDVRKHERN
jgi:cyclase